MHHKDIKAKIRKQLKIQYPNWKRLSRKKKKAVAKMVLDEVVSGYNFSQEIKTPMAELLGIEEHSSFSGIMELKRNRDSSDECHRRQTIIAGRSHKPICNVFRGMGP